MLVDKPKGSSKMTFGKDSARAAVLVLAILGISVVCLMPLAQSAAARPVADEPLSPSPTATQAGTELAPTPIAPTDTLTPEPTLTSTPTFTPEPAWTPTSTLTPEPSLIPTYTPTGLPTPTRSEEIGAIATPTRAAPPTPRRQPPTMTAIPEEPTAPPTGTPVAPEPTAPPTTSAVSQEPTETPTRANWASLTATPAELPTPSAVPTVTVLPTPSATRPVRFVPTMTASPPPMNYLPTATVSPAPVRFVPTITASPAQPSAPTPTATGSGAPTSTQTPLAAPAGTMTATLEPTPAGIATPSGTIAATETSLPPVTGIPTGALTVTATLEPALTPTSQISITLTPTLAPTSTFTVTLTPTLTPSATVSATLTITSTPTITPTWTPIPLKPLAAFPPELIPQLPAAAPTIVPGPVDPHVNYSAGTDKCAGCHSSHTGGAQVLRRTWPEEGLCFACHTSGGTGTNVQQAFTANGNSGSRFFTHDVAATNGAHSAGENSGDGFGGAGRHAECEDCHSPHKATRGGAAAPAIQQVMTGASGVDPQWTGVGAAASFSWMAQPDREYQVCLKCHSGFASQPSYAPDGWDGSAYVADGLRKLTNSSASQVRDSRDMAQEFNPYNGSFHPVVAAGRNQTIPAASFVSGWSQSSMVYCADCHNNANSGSQGVGTHGSPLLHLLVGAAANGGQVNYTTVTRSQNPAQPSNQELCFKCHSTGTYLTGSNPGSTTNFRKSASENLHLKHSQADSTCYSCHDSHGSEQEHLLNFEIGPQLSVPAGRNSQTAWFAVGSQYGCALTCHGKEHTGDTSDGFRYP